MDPNLITPQQAIASLANIAPFLWPFVLLSLGVALTPVSPISWSYSTWLLFIIPLIITVFAPVRTFSGPLRFAYLEYASKIASLAVSLLKSVVTHFNSIPTLALPALFFLPMLPILLFVVFPALPVIWHFIAYHYRRRLKAVATSVAKTNASLDLAIARARQALVLAHTYEKQALHTVSTTRTTPLVALSRHSVDFSTPVFNNAEGQWRLIQSPGTLGANLAGKVLDTEKQMTVIEDASQVVRTLSEQAVAVATEGDMMAGEELAENAAHSLENVVKQVDELRSTADQARCMWVEFRRRLNKVAESTSTTTAGLDLAIDRARQALVLAHTYEKQALHTVSTTRTTPLVALSQHSIDFNTPVFNDAEGQWQLVQSPGTLGADLAGKVLDTENQMTVIEDASQGVRALFEQAVAVATDGDVMAGEELAGNAAHSLENVVKQVDELRSMADQARCMWVEFRRRLNKVTESASTTTASLDLAIAHARQALVLAHTYEKQALHAVSTTRTTPLVALSRHSVDFSTPVFNNAEGQWQLVQSPGTLGADLARKVLDTEKQMAVIEDASQGVRALSEQAVAVATEGDMMGGEELAENAAHSLENVVKQVDELRSTADQARCMWVEFRRRLNKVAESTSTTTAGLDLVIAHAREALVLAHTYEKQALHTVSTTRTTPLVALSRHSVDFSTPVFNNAEGQWRLIQSPGTLGADLAGKVLDTEKQMAVIEDASQGIRALSEQAVTVATEGDMMRGEKLAENAAHSLENVVEQVDELRLMADQARCTWVEFRRRLNRVTASASTTTASLDLAVTRARRATTLAHTYEEQALTFVSTTRRTASQTLALHDADFFEPSAPVQQARKVISTEAERVRKLGNSLADTITLLDGRIGEVESEAENIRALLEQAVTAMVDGDVANGETLTANAADSLKAVIESVREVYSTSDDVRQAWVQLSVKYWTIP